MNTVLVLLLASVVVIFWVSALITHSMTWDAPARAQPYTVRWMQRGARLLAIAATLLGCLVLLGWLLNVPLLISVNSRWMTMKVNTALCFILSGAALWFILAPSGHTQSAQRVSRVCAAAVGLLALLTLSEYLGGWDLGIDNLLLAPPPRLPQTAFPGRMSPATAACFMLWSGGLLLLNASHGRRPYIAQMLAVITACTAVLAIIGYLYGVESLYAVRSFSSIAIHTAGGLLALSVGLLWARPETGWMRAMVDVRPGGFVLRWLLPTAVIIPTTLGWLRLLGQRLGLYGTEFGLALMVIASSLIFIALGWWIAAALNLADARRVQAEDETRRLNLVLEERVAARTRELYAAQERMVRQERLAVLGQLAGSAGHELRNPLGVIANAVYFLRLVQPQATPKIQEYLTLIADETHAAGKIVDDLLDFSRQQMAQRTTTTVAQLLQRALERFPPPAQVTVRLDLPADLPAVRVDPGQLTQVFGNLIVNACQAMPNGGELTLAATLRQDGWMAISVQDTGVGIPPENLPKLFEPLFTTKARGIGLGLAICRRLTEASGGQISVQSEPGKGSIFTVTLPGEEVDR